jgi:hypothetical protein
MILEKSKLQIPDQYHFTGLTGILNHHNIPLLFIEVNIAKG